MFVVLFICNKKQIFKKKKNQQFRSAPDFHLKVKESFECQRNTRKEDAIFTHLV